MIWSLLEATATAHEGGEKRDVAMLARVAGGTPVGSHRPCPTVVRVWRRRALVAAAAAAHSARSERAELALEQGVEQMVYVSLR